MCNFPPTVLELCVYYGQKEEEMVDELIAFCTSTHKANITSETLNSFEHEVRTKCERSNDRIRHFCSVGEAV